MSRCPACPRSGWAECASCASPITAGGPHAHRFDARSGKLDALCAECDYVAILCAYHVLRTAEAARAEHPELPSAVELLRTRRIAILIQGVLPL